MSVSWIIMPQWFSLFFGGLVLRTSYLHIYHGAEEHSLVLVTKHSFSMVESD